MTALDTQRGARDVLDSCRARWEPALLRAVNTLPDATAHIVGYHFGWWDADGTPAGPTGGKAIRPALTLLSAAAVGATESAVQAALAVELVHNFSLMHDDVMDDDRTRRHRPTAWVVFGVGQAILAGDALLTLAMDVLATSGQPAASQGVRMLSGAVQELVDGQFADLAFERRTDVGLPECLAMADGKTGALLGTACALGALVGGGTPEQVRGLERFGRELGLAFQLVDDLLGIWGEPTTTGKPVHSDLRCRKKSVPVVAALTSATPEGGELHELYHRDTELSEEELVRAADLIERAGGRAWCVRRAGELLDSGLSELATATTVSTAAADLGTIAQLITRRDH